MEVTRTVGTVENYRTVKQYDTYIILLRQCYFNTYQVYLYLPQLKLINYKNLIGNSYASH